MGNNRNLVLIGSAEIRQHLESIGIPESWEEGFLAAAGFIQEFWLTTDEGIRFDAVVHAIGGLYPQLVERLEREVNMLAAIRAGLNGVPVKLSEFDDHESMGLAGLWQKAVAAGHESKRKP